MRIPAHFLRGLAIFLLASAGSRAVEIGDLFKPFATEQASLSPDGKHLAYSLRRESEIRLVILNLETNKAKEIPVAADTVEALSGNKEKTPAQITYMRWATPQRLVFSVEDLAIWGIDADGQNARPLVRARDLYRLDEQPGAAPSAIPSARQIRPLTERGSNNPAIGPGGLGPAVPPEGLSESGEEEEEAAEDGSIPRPENETGDVFDSRRGMPGTYPRRPYVLDVLPEDPNTILVEGRGDIGPTEDSLQPNSGDLSAMLYKVDIRTGKFLAEHEYPGATRALPDQQGRLRIALAHASGERRFIHLSSGNALTRPLDAFLGEKNALGFRFSPENYLGQRSIPLAFDRDPNLLYFASNVGRDTYGIYALNLATKQRTELALEHRTYDLADFEQPLAGRNLVFDRRTGHLAGLRFVGARAGTTWLDPDLARVQAVIEKSLPGKTVQVLEWDDTRSRFLAFAFDLSDPGTYYVYEPATKKLAEHMRRAPWLDPEQLAPVRLFSFDSPDGVRLQGYLTLPRETRLELAPLVVYCHDGPWNRDVPSFNRGAQALARMGFAVAQVNYRGSSGFGLKHQEALRAGYDSVALADIAATVDHLVAQYPFNPKLVAVLGNGYGGYLALRAVQVQPDRFRCAVGLNAPTDLVAWLANPPGDLAFKRDVRRAFFGRDRARLAAISPLTEPEKFSRPVLLVHGDTDALVPVAQSRSLHRALAKNPENPPLLILPNEGHGNWLPGTYTRVFNAIEEFFNASIYSYAVKLGPAVEVKDAKPAPKR